MVADPKLGARLPDPGDPRALYVIDISGYVFRAYHALPPLQSPKGEPTHAVLGVTTMLLKLVADQRPAMLAVAMDSRGKSFRHELFEGYKATRPVQPPDLSQQITRLREIIDAYAIPVLQQEGIEADDLIATVVRKAREHDMHVVIVSADKDMLQLVGHEVVMYDTGRNVVYGPAETVTKLGVKPEQVRDYLALVGDTSDNVPGVPSVGPKTAQSLLADYGDLDQIYAAAAQIPKKGLREKLLEHRDKAFLSRDLVTLRDTLDVSIDPEALLWQGADLDKLHQMFTELGFTRLVTDLAKLGKAPSMAPGAPAAPPLAATPMQPCRTITELAELAEVASALRSSQRCLIVPVSDDPHAVRAGIVGLIVAWDAADPVYVPLGHRYLGQPSQLEAAQVFEQLKPALEAETPNKLCIDVKRAWTLLARNGVKLKGVTFDLMLASYLVDAERHGHSLRELSSEFHERDLLPAQIMMIPPTTGTARVSDVTVEAATVFAQEIVHVARFVEKPLLERLEALKCGALLQDVELPLARVLSRMERTGIRVDVTLLKRLSTRVAEDLTQLEAKCQQLAGRDFNVGSPRQLEAILFDELKLPVVKRTKTARSTDADVLEELARKHELPAAILEHRMLAKLKNTYLDALPREIDPQTGRIHTDFRQTVAATGRLSSSEPNLQNIPIRTDIGRSIRGAFVPREGWSILSADYSQIELRVLAHLSHDAELIEAYTKNEDVHIRTARAIFGVDTEGVTREMRGQAKTVNFAVIYGQTQFALARNLGIERSEAARYIQAFFERYAGVKRYMEETVAEARVSGVTHTLLGRVRVLPDMNNRNRQLREAAERIARNTPIQGTAADIIKIAMVSIGKAIQERGMQSRMLLSVHDELVLEAPPEEKAALEALVVSSMESAISLDVPLVVERGWGQSWGEAH
ncbi:MAG TPA: DNA polymerase I [Polyangiales bacterium]|nr:DNA polymerase I [Polyangiales bacterium]